MVQFRVKVSNVICTDLVVKNHSGSVDFSVKFNFDGALSFVD